MRERFIAGLNACVDYIAMSLSLGALYFGMFTSVIHDVWHFIARLTGLPCY